MPPYTKTFEALLLEMHNLINDQWSQQDALDELSLKYGLTETYLEKLVMAYDKRIAYMVSRNVICRSPGSMRDYIEKLEEAKV